MIINCVGALSLIGFSLGQAISRQEYSLGKEESDDSANATAVKYLSASKLVPCGSDRDLC